MISHVSIIVLKEVSMWKLEIMIYSDETIENLYIYQVILFQQLTLSERMRLKGKMVRNNIYRQIKYVKC